MRKKKRELISGRVLEYRTMIRPSLTIMSCCMHDLSGGKKLRMDIESDQLEKGMILLEQVGNTHMDPIGNLASSVQDVNVLSYFGEVKLMSLFVPDILL